MPPQNSWRSSASVSSTPVSMSVRSASVSASSSGSLSFIGRLGRLNGSQHKLVDQKVSTYGFDVISTKVGGTMRLCSDANRRGLQLD